jgi:cysteine synthase
MITEQRKELYEELERQIGKTPLVKFGGEISNGNAIYLKRECDNPFGSHYDRVYLMLFNHFENQGRIKPGDKVLETTSGAAGVSFAGIGRRLGYECYVALPAGGEKAREEAIKSQLESAGHLILTPAEKYISGFPNFLRGFLPNHQDCFFLNHSRGSRDRQTGRIGNNEVTLVALEDIANEVLDEGIEVDYFVPAVGNGSSVLGPGRVFQQRNQLMYNILGTFLEEGAPYNLPNFDFNSEVDTIESARTKIVAFETFQSAVAYELMYPGEYQKLFGIKPGTLSRHRLPGTSFQGIDFPHIRNSIDGRVIDKVILVSDARMDSEYNTMTNRNDTESLPHWDISYSGNNDLGRSTRAGISVALEIAKTVNGKNFLVIAYDKSDRYDK